MGYQSFAPDSLSVIAYLIISVVLLNHTLFETDLEDDLPPNTAIWRPPQAILVGAILKSILSYLCNPGGQT